MFKKGRVTLKTTLNFSSRAIFGRKLLERGEISTIVCQSSFAPGLMAMWFWWAMPFIQWCPIWGRADAKPLRTGRNQPDVVMFGHKKLHFLHIFTGWIQDMQETKLWQILDKLWNFDREMIFDERSHPKMLSQCEDAYELTRILSGSKTYAEDFDPKAGWISSTISNRRWRINFFELMITPLP